METSLVIVFIGLLIFGAHLFNGIFKFTKIPNVLILLIIGIILGPVLGVVKEAHFGSVGSIFTTVTLILLLFESGTSLKISELVASIGSAFLITIFNFIGSTIIGGLCAYTMLSLDIMSAAFFGIIIAATSAAVVIPVIKQLKMNEKAATTLLLESALGDVLCLVIGLALLQSMEQGVFELSEIANHVWKSFLLAMLVGLVAGLLWSVVIHRTRIIENSIVMNVACVFLVYGVTEHMELNGGIATLIFGITLGNAHMLNKTFLRRIVPSQELKQNEKDFFGELVFLFSSFFFVYIGICMKFGSVWIYLVALIVMVGIILIRPLSIKLMVKSKMSFKDLSIMSIMTPKGLVPAILGSIPLQMGIAGGDKIQSLAFAVVLVSIVLCAILIIILSNNPFSIGYLRNILGQHEPTEQTEENLVNPMSLEDSSNNHDAIDDSGEESKGEA